MAVTRHAGLMKRKTLFLLITALLLPLAARAQSATQAAPPAQQPAKPYSTLDDDPQFRRMPPEQQELVRKMMENVGKALADEKNSGATPNTAPKPAPATPAPNTPAPQAGCIAPPVKTPKFHLPKPLQDAINKGAKNIGSKTGVALDPNAPAQTVSNAQKNIPCPPAPAQPVRAATSK
jgi:hypothetical protein